jgi:penicillin amidase
MIVHLTDPVEALGVYPGGQSGNPGSAHYTDMIDTWRKGKYYHAKYVHSPEELDGGTRMSIKPKQQ